jgi:hypothetical protein
MRLRLAAVLLPVALVGAAEAACTKDVLCVEDCHERHCGPSDPNGVPKEIYADCIETCRDEESQCSEWVACMKGCEERRDAQLDQCRGARKACIRTQCRVCTGSFVAAAPALGCYDQCLADRQACRKNVRGQKARVRHCRDKCDDRCGEFPQFPGALAECYERCGEGPSFSECGTKDDCRAQCATP